MATQPTVHPTPFPAPSKSASLLINNLLTTATSISFSDKLLLTLSGPSGKLAHWVHIPMSGSTDPMNPSFTSHSSDLLPRTDLTATTVLGGTKREDEVVGQTLATTLASALLMKRPNEERMLLLGLGVQGLGDGGEASERDVFEGLVGLCLEVL